MNCRSHLTLALTVLALASAAGPVAANAQASCDASGCHGELKKRPRPHAALEMMACEDCHTETGAANEACGSGRAFQVDEGVCAGCHETPASEGRHAAVEMGCSTCHDAHGARVPNLLKQRLVDVCLGCHEAPPTGPGAHMPVVEGECTSCHDPHRSDHPSLLVESGQALCRMCHDVASEGQVHPPVEDDCSYCHAPHGSDVEGALTRPAGSLCLDCHEAPEAKIRHYPVAAGRCADCHEPHASKHSPLLKAAGRDLCLSCHGPSAEGATRSRRVVALEGTVHMPAEDGCDGCHVPHGSSQPYLLQAPQKELCGQCHEVTSKPFVHGAVKLGRCGGCHDPHASTNPSLTRATGSELCFRCHADDVTGRAVVHAPVAEGDCLTCHPPHDSDHPKLLTESSVTGLCNGCHGIDLKKPHVHEAVKRFECSGCHDPHGAAEARLLAKPINGLCVTCHEPQGSGSHVFNGPRGKPHPLAGVPDPAREGRELSCTGCHQPHVSENPRLWYEGDTQLESCARCHDGYGMGGKKTGQSARRAAPIGSAAGGVRAAEPTPEREAQVSYAREVPDEVR